MFSKFELIAAGTSVFFMALALYLVQVESTLFATNDVSDQASQVAAAQQSGVVIAEDASDNDRAQAYLAASDSRGNVDRLVVDDVKIGRGSTVESGDTVTVHYVGTLRNGQEFDNSRKRGAPFTFTVGSGEVIEGWDRGLVGMQEGGQRILVIPPQLAYGDTGVGPIPGGATLVFAIELIEIE